MGYRKIPNLYKDKTILMFKECYCSEKVHGTSTRIIHNPEHPLKFLSGGIQHDKFIKIFDVPLLQRRFRELFLTAMLRFTGRDMEEETDSPSIVFNLQERIEKSNENKNHGTPFNY